MFDLQEVLNELMETKPCIHTHHFNGQRDLQDFTERDFDRSLEAVKVQALVTIANVLELYVNEELFGDVDTGAAVG